MADEQVVEIKAIPDEALALLGLAVTVAMGKMSDANIVALSKAILSKRHAIWSKVRVEDRARTRASKAGRSGWQKLLETFMTASTKKAVEESKTAAGAEPDPELLKGPLVEILVDMALDVMGGDASLTSLVKSVATRFPNPQGRQLASMVEELKIPQSEMDRSVKEIMGTPEGEEWQRGVERLIGRVSSLLASGYAKLENTSVKPLEEDMEKSAMPAVVNHEDAMKAVEALLAAAASGVARASGGVVSEKQALDKIKGSMLPEVSKEIQDMLKKMLFRGNMLVNGQRDTVGVSTPASATPVSVYHTASAEGPKEITPESAQQSDPRVEVIHTASGDVDPVALFGDREEDLSGEGLPSNIHDEIHQLLNKSAALDVSFGSDSDPFGNVL